MARQVMLLVAWAAFGGAVSLADNEVPITHVAVRGIGWLGERLVVRVADLPAWAAGGRLALAREREPLAWLEWIEILEGGGAFVSRGSLDSDLKPAALRAWVIGPDLVARLRHAWPLGAELHARVETVGLGARSVWIDAGTNHAIEVGDCWWRRAAGQPVARYDVRWVGSDFCYCRAVPLATGSRPQPGEMVSLWPAPGQRRVGRAAGAASFVATRGDDQLVWVAMPPKVAAPPEPRVDFKRDGDYVCSGIVEQRDARFWYVRTLPATCATDVRVGDDAFVRTAADIRQRRISARVFELTPTGGLINAGEIDGLLVGDVGTVWRGARQVGCVELAKVQRGYSVARLLGDSGYVASTQAVQSDDERAGAAPDGLRRLDEVRFGSPPPSPVTLGVIEHVVDGTLFSARVEGTRVTPLRAPLELQRAGRTIGVVVLLEVGNGHALGFAMAPSLSVRPAAGDVVTVSPECSDRATSSARLRCNLFERTRPATIIRAR